MTIESTPSTPLDGATGSPCGNSSTAQFLANTYEKYPLPADLSPGVKLLAEGVDKTQNARDALVSLLPVGLGAKGGEFNKVYMDAFQRIVLRGEPVKAALDAQAAQLKAIIDETKAPCWAPDKASGDKPCPVM